MVIFIQMKIENKKTPLPLDNGNIKKKTNKRIPSECMVALFVEGRSCV